MLAFKRFPESGLVQYKLLPLGKLGHPKIIDAQDVGRLVGRVTTPLNTRYVVERTTVVGQLNMLDVTVSPD